MRRAGFEKQRSAPTHSLARAWRHLHSAGRRHNEPPPPAISTRDALIPRSSWNSRAGGLGAESTGLLCLLPLLHNSGLNRGFVLVCCWRVGRESGWIDTSESARRAAASLSKQAELAGKG